RACSPRLHSRVPAPRYSEAECRGQSALLRRLQGSVSLPRRGKGYAWGTSFMATGAATANAAPHSYCSQWPVVPSAAPVGRVALAGRFARPVAEGARAARSATFAGVLAVVLQLRSA